MPRTLARTSAICASRPRSRSRAGGIDMAQARWRLASAAGGALLPYLSRKWLSPAEGQRGAPDEQAAALAQGGGKLHAVRGDSGCIRLLTLWLAGMPRRGKRMGRLDALVACASRDDGANALGAPGVSALRRAGALLACLHLPPWKTVPYTSSLSFCSLLGTGRKGMRTTWEGGGAAEQNRLPAA